MIRCVVCCGTDFRSSKGSNGGGGGSSECVFSRTIQVDRIGICMERDAVAVGGRGCLRGLTRGRRISTTVYVPRFSA